MFFCMQVEMIVHPSIQPNDDIVNRVIEEIRFRLSSSYTAVRWAQTQEQFPLVGSFIFRFSLLSQYLTLSMYLNFVSFLGFNVLLTQSLQKNLLQYTLGTCFLSWSSLFLVVFYLPRPSACSKLKRKPNDNNKRAQWRTRSSSPYEVLSLQNHLLLHLLHINNNKQVKQFPES